MTPRLPPRTEVPPEVAEILDRGLKHDGRPFNAAATIAHHPRLLKRFSVLAGLFLTHSELPARDRELLTLRSTYRAQSEYYYGHHVAMARRAGLTDAQIRAAATEDEAAAPAPGWTDHERLLLRVADELMAGTELEHATWKQLHSAYRDDQVVEAVMIVGFYRMVGGLVNTLGVERERGVPGWPE